VVVEAPRQKEKVMKDTALWTLAGGAFPPVDVSTANPIEAVHDRYGPPYGPCGFVRVEGGASLTDLAVSGDLVSGGIVRSVVAALRNAGEAWRSLSATPGADGWFAVSPRTLTLVDVAASAPHGLLLAEGLARVEGLETSVEVVDGSAPV
jgi:hypothetical protein